MLKEKWQNKPEEKISRESISVLEFLKKQEKRISSAENQIGNEIQNEPVGIYKCRGR